MSQDSGDRVRFDCPHCGSWLKIRTSKQMTPTYRVIYFYCSDKEECGYRTTADVEITHTLSPSRNPNPEINIPLHPSVIKQFEQMGFEIREAKTSAS